MKRELTKDDFIYIDDSILDTLNQKIKEKDFYTLKSLLPEGFLQTRMVDFNYAVLRNIFRQRRHHKLREWRLFCSWIMTLPYSDLIIKEGRL